MSRTGLVFVVPQKPKRPILKKLKTSRIIKLAVETVQRNLSLKAGENITYSQRTILLHLLNACCYLGFLLMNLRIYLHWLYVSLRRQGGRQLAEWRFKTNAQAGGEGYRRCPWIRRRRHNSSLTPAIHAGKKRDCKDFSLELEIDGRVVVPSVTKKSMLM
jgi:hypothetical protein